MNAAAKALVMLEYAVDARARRRSFITMMRFDAIEST